MKFSVLNNGLVRAKGKNFGENSQVDFKVQCDGKNCQIDDIYTPDSYKKEVIAIVKMMCAELAGDFHLGDSRQLTDKSLLPFDLVS